MLRPLFIMDNRDELIYRNKIVILKLVGTIQL
jgi:hypothetical protein